MGSSQGYAADKEPPLGKEAARSLPRAAPQGPVTVVPPGTATYLCPHHCQFAETRNDSHRFLHGTAVVKGRIRVREARKGQQRPTVDATA
ncbi:hypothetical protein GCM10028796_12810 [Ramlibacter monticola]